jgi:hypothetical protein
MQDITRILSRNFPPENFACVYSAVDIVLLERSKLNLNRRESNVWKEIVK